MNADEAEERLANALAVWDEALAAGSQSTPLTAGDLPTELQSRLQQNLACLHWLQNLRPARNELAATPLPVDKSLAPETLPRRLGRYEIRRLLGRGGFAAVFQAFDPVLGREAALKVPRRDLKLFPVLHARFQQEARAAAGLDHPHLVAVYEAGEVDSVCYIASAYCEGPTLAQWLAACAKPPPIRDAAELIALLAEAVQHAHSRGILHRDLKPANVLLVPLGQTSGAASEPGPPRTAPLFNEPLTAYQPKITDFGLAKCIADGDQAMTASGDIVGTPQYMAPEQAEGKAAAVTTAVDVYALGAILYELLTGQAPFRGGTALEILEHARAEEPRPPRRLRADVPRDLNVICLKCLEKDPARRYTSPAALAEDLRRFLSGETIQARPAGTWERGVKWARRRPAWAALVALTAAGLVAALAAGAWHQSRLSWYNRELQAAVDTANTQAEVATGEWQRAESNLDEARDVVDQMLTRLGTTELEGVPHLESLRRDLLERALIFYQGALRQRSGDRPMRRDTAWAYYQVGKIRALLGQYAEAADALGQSQTLWNELRAESPEDPHCVFVLAEVLNRKGQALQKLGKRSDAAAAFREACDLAEAPPGKAIQEPHCRHTLADSLNALGVLMNEGGESAASEKTLRRALELSQEALAAAANPLPHYRELPALCQNNLGTVLLKQGRLDDAALAFQQAGDLRRTLADEFPLQPLHRLHLAGALGNLGMAQKELGRTEQAEASGRQAIELVRRLAADFPRVPEYRKDLAQHLYNQGVLLRGVGRTKDAEQAYRDALVHLEWLVAQDPKVPEYHGVLSRVLNNLYVVVQRQDLKEARRCLEQGLTHARQALALAPQNDSYRESLFTRQRNYCDVLLSLKDHRAAADAAQTLARLDSDKAAVRFHCARLLAWCLRFAQNDAELRPEQRTELAQRYGSQAVAELGEAIRLGYQRVGELKSDAAFAPLRSRDDFQKLLRELEHPDSETLPPRDD